MYVDTVDSAGITLRPVHSGDEPFILRLYASSRPDLEWITGINEERKDSLIYQQFQCEQAQTMKEYPEGNFNIVLLEGEPIGRLYISREMEIFRIIAISLLPEYRRRGIGCKLLNGVMEEASRAGRQVRLQVAWYNFAARTLYEKLGFAVIEDAGVYCDMRWTPLAIRTRGVKYEK